MPSVFDTAIYSASSFSNASINLPPGADPGGRRAPLLRPPQKKKEGRKGKERKEKEKGKEKERHKETKMS